jgi:formate dehydrogenase subunit gamma
MNLELSRRHFHSRRGTVGAMTRGQVTGGWAWRHHRKWLKELVTT